MRANQSRTPFTRRDERRFYLFVLPWLLGLLLFQAGPILAAIALSFTDWNLVASPEWRGLAHYDELIDDPLFHTALKNTLYYALISVPLGVGLAFGLALLVNRGWFGMGFFRTVFLLPALVSGAAIALVWGWLFNPRFGAVNAALRALHLPTPGWLADPSWAMPTIILLSLWSVGGTMLIYLAGLRTIPRELYDAARIDGAGPLALTRHVTLPLLSPTTYFLLVVGTIMSLQLFTPTYILTEGGPRNSTLTLPLYIYRNAFEWQELGYAATLSVVLILLTLILTLIQVALARRWVFYAGAAPASVGGEPMSTLAESRALDTRVAASPATAIRIRRVSTRVAGRIVVYTLLTGLALLFLLPLFWMLTTAFKPQQLVYRFPPVWLSTDWTLTNFRTGWNALPFARFFINSAFITLLTVAGTVLSSSLAGFGFARYRGRGAALLFIVLLATMMVPASTTLIPRFVMFAKIGWTDSFLPLVLPPFFAGPFFVFLFRQFFRSIPREYFDAAEIDGCSPFGLYWRIAMPMAKPAIAASAMFSALAAWNDFIDPLVFLTSTDKQTYQIGLSTFQGQYFNQLHLMMPMALLGVVPVLLLVIAGQRWIANGIAGDVEK